MIIILKTDMLSGMGKAAEDWTDLALDALASEGRRAGGAKRAVVEQLAGESCCVSAQDVAEGLRQRGRRVGVASVYRALDALSSEGLVQRIELGDGAARFEPVVPGGDHHHHVVCDTCGRLTPFEDEGLERAIHRLAEGLSHSVHGHDVLIRGECASCARKR
jgi:Fur family ferric uptake transcriptional regulator